MPGCITTDEASQRTSDICLAICIVARFRETWAAGSRPKMTACTLHLQVLPGLNASSTGHVGKPAMCWL